MNGLNHYEKDIRPWGHFERFTLNEPCTVKIHVVNANEVLSLQRHEHRDEMWRILAGSGSVVIGDETRDAHAGDDFLVERGEKHRIAAGPDGVTFLEIAFGNFDEGDITRFEDKYGRA